MQRLRVIPGLAVCAIAATVDRSRSAVDLGAIGPTYGIAEPHLLEADHRTPLAREGAQLANCSA